jgi:hypothetical protein
LVFERFLKGYKLIILSFICYVVASFVLYYIPEALVVLTLLGG